MTSGQNHSLRVTGERETTVIFGETIKGFLCSMSVSQTPVNRKPPGGLSENMSSENMSSWGPRTMESESSGRG